MYSSGGRACAGCDLNYFELGAGITLALSILGLIAWVVSTYGKLLVSKERVKDDQIEAETHTLSDDELNRLLKIDLGRDTKPPKTS